MTHTTMTCTECLTMVASADLAELTTAAAVTEHCGTCVDCATIVDEVSRETRLLAESLDGAGPGVPAQVVALRAVARSTVRARRGKRLRMALIALAVLIVPLTAVPLLVSRATPVPPLEQRVVELKCLGPEQALELTRPSLPPTISAYIRPVSLPILTLKGPPADVATARRSIEAEDARWGAERPEYCLVLPHAKPAPDETDRAAKPK